MPTSTVRPIPVIPTVIANAFYLPRHLLPEEEEQASAAPAVIVPLRQAAEKAD